MSSPKRFRVGIIGGGHVARDLHLPGYVKHPDRLELVAAAEIDPRRCDALRDRFGFRRVYADYGEMLDREQFDVVGVFLPWELNEAVCGDVAARGMNILCEKPLATSLPIAERIVGVARRAGVKLRVNLNYRFFHDVVQAKSDLDSGSVGLPYFIEFREYARWTPGSYGYSTWDSMERSSEPFWGATEGDKRYIWLTKSVHYVDLVRHLTGSEIADIYVQMGRHGGLEVPGEDFATALLTTQSGVRATLLNHWGSHQWGHRGVCLTCETRIQCENGTIHVASRPPYPEHGEYVVYRDGREAKRTDLSSDWSDSFAASMLELVSAVEEGREPLSNGEDYLRTQRVIEAGYLSARENRVVRLDW